jgi:AmmeMemoRadiSam system protein A
MSERENRGATLLAIARAAIERPGESGIENRWPEGWLNDPGASFVTLHLAGELRGCIGSIEAHRPLGEDVARNARAAAYRDPRFPPVSGDEIPRLQVEVSVLSPRQPLPAKSESDVIAMMRPGIDGICLDYGEMRSTFLPQVWESLPEPGEFLGELKRKAGLPRTFWHPDLRLSRYTVDKFR